MAAIITHSAGTITPGVIDGFSATIPARTIVHAILGRSDPDITFKPAGLRTGTLQLVFATGADAAAAVAALRIPQVLTLSDADVPEVGMSFVVAEGDLVSALDPRTRRVWTVTVPFQEVLP